MSEETHTAQAPGRQSKAAGETPLPRFALPEVVGVTMNAEEIARIVQGSVVEMAAGLDCPRLVALSYVPREGLVRGVTTIGFEDPTIREWLLPLSEFPIAERAIRTRQILVFPDASGLSSRLAPHFHGEIVVVPLVLGSRVLAVLIGDVAPGVVPRSAAWQARAEEVAARAALVVELERLASAYQDELRLRESGRMVAAAILEGRPLPEIAELITDIVARRLRVERVALFLKDDADHFHPAALRNVSAAYAEGIARLPRPSPIAARAMASGLPYFARNVQEDPQLPPHLRDLFRREGITSVMVAMLQYEKTILGGLAVYPEEEREFTPAEIGAFRSWADQATLVVAMTQQMEQQRDMAMMEERNRLAREMHDTVAQALAGLALHLETAQTLLADGDVNAAAEMLAASRTLAKKALEDTRRAVQGLAPESLERLSPAQAIEAEAQQVEVQEGIPVPFILTGDEQPLLPEQRLALLRIAQEALTNARKHAQAQRIRVGLQYGPDSVTLLVEDDGSGFDTAALDLPTAEGGYGLFGMQERARLLGGEVQIESTPGWGTRVRAILPYHPASTLAARQAELSDQPPGIHDRTAPSPSDGESRHRPGSPAEGERLPGTPSPTREERQGRRSPEPSGRPSETIPFPARQDRPASPTDYPQRAATPLIRVLVADDHAMIRQGIRTMLEASGEIAVVGEAADGAEAVEQARLLRPDVVLMDLQMPRIDGLEGLRRLHAEQPGLPVIILTTFQDDAAVTEALRSGARGYLLKDAEPADLLAAIRAAQRGEALLSPAITERLTQLASGQADRTTDMPNERELEILQLLAQGARNKEIAARLFITAKTVEYHLTNLFARLGVTNRTEAVRVAIERGLVIPDSRSLK